MKIVIDIPEDDYNAIRDNIKAYSLADMLFGAVQCGTPLSKGHGNLVDADKVILGLVYGKHIDNANCVEIAKIFDSAVVIPVDMRGKEE